ncbi:hypothetical protein VIGAN_08295800, partial [Vigna angularis var. angularis]
MTEHFFQDVQHDSMCTVPLNESSYVSKCVLKIKTAAAAWRLSSRPCTPLVHSLLPSWTCYCHSPNQSPCQSKERNGNSLQLLTSLMTEPIKIHHRCCFLPDQHELCAPSILRAHTLLLHCGCHPHSSRDSVFPS